MYFIALAADYDGTVAHDGVVDDETIGALERLKETGRKLILVTGRELPDLQRVCARLDLFDRVVAENGALLYLPASEEERPLARAPVPQFVERLRAMGVQPLSIGHSIVATWEPNETVVLEAIRDLGLEHQIIFNKGAVMVLPPGVNKAFGLAAALDDLGISPLNVVGVGDAENDHAFLQACGCAVAVENALPVVKEEADIVTAGARGAGVAELCDLIAENLLDAAAAMQRHSIVFATDEQGRSVSLSPRSGGVLIAGSSGGGKSTLATLLLERLVGQGFQFCALDPEGDYLGLEQAIALGDAKTAPRMREIFELLWQPKTNVVVNMLGLDVADRPRFFAQILPGLARMRAGTGRPHWILIDEAHHMLPAAHGSVPMVVPQELPAAILVTVHPDAVSREALALIDTVLGIGGHAPDVIRALCETLGEDCPILPGSPPAQGQALLWRRRNGDRASIITLEQSVRAHHRHVRKYAEGNLGEDKSFYFRGPDGALNLRAQNLNIFVQIADGVDEATWSYHRQNGDYSEWIRLSVKDDDLADEIAGIETNDSLNGTESRTAVREAIQRRYTAPAEASA